MKLSLRTARLAVLVLLFAWTGYGVPAVADLTIGNYVLVSSKRVTRVEFEYTYRADVTNSGGAVSNTTARVTSTSPNTVIVDNVLRFGDVAAGATVTSTDTFTLRQNRSYRFDPSVLHWQVSNGVLLEGAPTQLAISATRLIDDINGVATAEIGVDETGMEVARTELMLELEPTATVGEVNNLLTSIGARIVWMMPQLPYLLIRFSDPGSMTGLNAIVASLMASPAIKGVERAYFPKPSAIPTPYDASTLANFGMIDQLVSVHAPAVWNAQRALDFASPPTVLIADWFGDGPPLSPPFMLSNVFGDFLSHLYTSGHGYHVLGILGADYGGDFVTALYPAIARRPLQVRAIDLETPPGIRLTNVEIDSKILVVLAADLYGQRVVLNTSMDYDCAPPGCSPAIASPQALRWTQLMRAYDLEGRVLHVTAAGNMDVAIPGDPWASVAHGYAAAALLPLQDSAGNNVPNLSNIIVVENAVNAPVPPYDPRCISTGSKVGGQLSAVGTGVESYVGPGFAWQSKNGTSMATPQVTGIATYVWAMAPGSSAAGVKAKLIDSARRIAPPDPLPAGCRNVEHAPVIDAYGALLRADRPQALVSGSPADAPVRSAILDVASTSGADGSDGFFNAGDLRRYQQGFADAVTASSPDASGCGGYDWSRYDLNGDGRTGSCHTDRFDLDLNGQIEVVTQTIDGNAVRFDEAQISDIDVLCYYAHSSLYQGTSADRTAVLGGVCRGGTPDPSEGIVTVAEWDSPNLTATEEREEDVRNADGSWGTSPPYPYTYYWEMTDPTEAAVAVAGSGDLFTVWTEPVGISLGAPCACTHYHYPCDQFTIPSCSEPVDPPGLPHTLIQPIITSHTFAIRAARLGPGRAVPDHYDLQVKTTATREGNTHTSVAVAANTRGDAIAVWIVSPKFREVCCFASIAVVVGEDEVWAARYLKEDGWSAPTLLWSGGTSSTAPKVSLDGTGNATVVWQTSDTERAVNLLMGKRFSAELGWGSTVTLDSSGICHTRFDLDASPNGQGIVVWSKGVSVVGRRYDSASDWGAEEVLGLARECVQPLLAMDNHGNGVVISSAPTAYWARRLEATTGWQPQISLQVPQSGELVGELVDVALGNDGRMALLGSDSRNILWGAHYDDASGSWTPGAVVAEGTFLRADSYSNYRPYGLLADNCGNLTAWGAALGSDEFFTVAARYYSAATRSWGPSAVLYSAENNSGGYGGGAYSPGGVYSPGTYTGVVGSDVSCGQLALAGIQVDVIEAANGYWSLEWSIGVSRLAVPKE